MWKFSKVYQGSPKIIRETEVLLFIPHSSCMVLRLILTVFTPYCSLHWLSDSTETAVSLRSKLSNWPHSLCSLHSCKHNVYQLWFCYTLTVPYMLVIILTVISLWPTFQRWQVCGYTTQLLSLVSTMERCNDIMWTVI